MGCLLIVWSVLCLCCHYVTHYDRPCNPLLLSHLPCAQAAHKMGCLFGLSFKPSLCARSGTSPDRVLLPPAGCLEGRHLVEGEGLEVAEERHGGFLGQELHGTTRHQCPSTERRRKQSATPQYKPARKEGDRRELRERRKTCWWRIPPNPSMARRPFLISLSCMEARSFLPMPRGSKPKSPAACTFPHQPTSVQKVKPMSKSAKPTDWCAVWAHGTHGEPTHAATVEHVVLGDLAVVHLQLESSHGQEDLHQADAGNLQGSRRQPLFENFLRKRSWLAERQDLKMEKNHTV